MSSWARATTTSQTALGLEHFAARQKLALSIMFALLFDLEDYATTYRATRDAYLKAANGV